MAPAWLGPAPRPPAPALRVLTWRRGPGLPTRWLWHVMVSRCRVCRTPSCSNWAMSFRGSQGLWLEGPEGSSGQGRGCSGEGDTGPAEPSASQQWPERPREGERGLRQCAGPPGRARQGKPCVTPAPTAAAQGQRTPPLTTRVGSATPGWRGPGGTAGASRARGSAGGRGPAASVPPPVRTSPAWPCAGHPP